MKRLIIILLVATAAIGGIAGAVEGPEIREALRKRWESFSPEKRRELKDRYRKFKDLPPERRQEIRRRFRKFMSLSAERRDALRERWRLLRTLPEEHRERIIQRHRRWKHMPPERREKIRQHIRKRFQEMPDRELISFFRRMHAWRMFSDQERRQLYERYLEIRRRHRKEHPRNDNGHHGPRRRRDR
jgi:hypothetical protein